jgi:DNA-binding PadR family transcriptional regulator
MKLIARITLVVLLFASLGGVALRAQENNGGGPRTSQAYYKIALGHQDEWLKLYKNYHYPILKALKEQGIIQSITLLKRDRHHLSPAWDYELQIVWRDKVAQATGGGPGLVHKIFTDWPDYQKNEARRWEITEEHWDEDLSPVPVE